ncbi:hypothetical protein [Undibacter mobilis]|nr:hypothetical protein [Undibacter mobilis]
MPGLLQNAIAVMTSGDIGKAITLPCSGEGASIAALDGSYRAI